MGILGDAHHAAPTRAPRQTRHYSTLILVALYIPVTIVPWAATCVLSTRPILPGAPTYQDARGRLSPSDLASVGSWMTAIRALDTIAALLAIPVVSAVLSHAAVVVAQRRSAAQNLNVRQLLSLADGSWARLTTKFPTKLSVLGIVLVIYSLVLPFTRAIVAAPEAITVASCLEDPSRQFTGPGCDAALPRAFSLGGFDPEPADIDRLPRDLVTARVASRLESESRTQTQRHLWKEGSDEKAATSIASLAPRGSPNPFFVSAVPAGINTGVLRQHAMRLSSTVKCSLVEVEEYPKSCPGDQPLTGTLGSGDGTVKFCVPGAHGAAAWSLSRNSQTIQEHVFLASWAGPNMGDSTMQSPRANFTARCDAETTRGYFELPNQHNGGRPGPLLAKWPSAAELQEQGFSDRLPNGAVPGETDSAESSGQPRPPFPAVASPFGTRNLRTPGPLMSTFLSALGNGSFLDLANKTWITGQGQAVLRGMCSRGLPFASLWPLQNSSTTECDNVESVPAGAENDRIMRLVLGWFARLDPATEQGRNSAEAAISAGMYLANEAVLALTAEAMQGEAGQEGNTAADGSRRVYGAQGTVVVKPRDAGLAAQVILSLLLALQLAVLLALAAVAACSRTIGDRLDAAVMLMAGARLRDELLNEGGITSSVSASRLGDVDASAALRLGGGHGRHRDLVEEDDDDFLLALPDNGRHTMHPSRSETPSPPPPSHVRSYKTYMATARSSGMLPTVEQVLSARPMPSRDASPLGRRASVHLQWIRHGDEAVATEAPVSRGRTQAPRTGEEVNDVTPPPTGYDHHMEGRKSPTRGPYSFHMPSSSKPRLGSPDGRASAGVEPFTAEGAGDIVEPAASSVPVAATSLEDDAQQEQEPPREPPPRSPKRNRAASNPTMPSPLRLPVLEPVSPMSDDGNAK
ncbi:hypothetical protein MAPG_11549 [Magnaporthiopsis poae ATCC 64411]|uniref:Uncharacterized protein n=1 Tax=Magnaporthiopsis poae (strain ATCC 64411 / 73-15) TaxID=644358 RepID=A0A0C4EFJ8_MAGP6|nr:hypothetical protein MAPG_11549 [Magnaporthiopsis poae ATCC 64411]